MDPNQQTAAEYYKHHRKRSIFSRITIFSSMAILLIVLAINVSVFYSQNTNTVQSHASTPENVENLLPSLPEGCHYIHVGNNVKIDCLNATPTTAQTNPVKVALPQLPTGCNVITANDGSSINCSLSHAPIPTVAVTLPTTCTVAKKPNSVTCTTENNQTTTTELPKLPDGCSYSLLAGQYFVVCEAK